MFKRTNERGFIFFELAIGLPLIIMTLWAMVHLFAGTWKNCRDLIADLTLQNEINNAMQRIVSDLRVASHAEITSNGRLQINSYLYQTVDKIYESSSGYGYESDNDNANKKLPIYYFHSSTMKGGKTYMVIYRQRDAYAKTQPLTGEDILSDVNIISFRRAKENSRLWDISIEAESRVSGHRYRLQTKVYVGGADR